MKKTLALLIALAMVFALAACGKAEEPVNTEPAAPAAEAQTEPAPEAPAEPAAPEAGIPNPMVAAESLDEINEKLGCNLVKPGVMGVTDENFIINNGTMGEYDFTVGGVSYTFRFADTAEDISGVYTGSSTLLDGAEDGVVVSADGFTGARWFAEEGQYCLLTNGEVEADTFEGIVSEMMSIQGLGGTDVAELPADSTPDPEGQVFQSWYDNLAGEWQDSTSGRACMTVESCGDHALVNVSWGNSANSTCEWTMNVTMEEAAEDGTNRLVYNDCTNREVVNDGETEVVTIFYENGEGYFTLNQGGFLLWDGAADENCTECVFEQILSATPLQ